MCLRKKLKGRELLPKPRSLLREVSYIECSFVVIEFFEGLQSDSIHGCSLPGLNHLESCGFETLKCAFAFIPFGLGPVCTGQKCRDYQESQHTDEFEGALA